jgi:Domain of unknown function (DUF4279)
MRVRQYACFRISSPSVSPHEITSRLLLEPDEVKPKGSRIAGPSPVPRVHLWKMMSGCADTSPLDEQFAALVARLEPREREIQRFLSSSDAQGWILAVRRFEAGAEDDAIVEPGRLLGGLERLRGQHPLLGFALDGRIVELAARMHVGFDFDEYGDEYE